MKSNYRGVLVVLSVVALSLGGCGSKGDRPELGQVTGTITLDGEPLGGIAVVFSPDSGRPSRGRTDSQGQYELTYIGQTLGAKLGHHRVEIAPNEEGEDELEDANAGESTAPAQPQSKPGKVKVPARYNTKSELQADIKPGANVFDFQLESKPAK